jgi:Cytochrome P460
MPLRSGLVGTLANQYGAWANIYRNGTAVGPARFPPVAAYHKDGHFPDGTVLVKEVFKTTTSNMTTGTVSSAGTLAGWFVMVKDNAGRFPGNKLWGEGWGWSWFDATNPQKTTSTTTRRTVSPVTCRRDSQTGSTRAAIRS